MPETERTRVTPGTPFICVSIGKLTSCSTSGGAAFRFRHDRDGRPVEVGKHVDRKLRDGVGAEEDKDGRNRQHEQPVTKRVADKEGEHDAVPHRT